MSPQFAKLIAGLPPKPVDALAEFRKRHSAEANQRTAPTDDIFASELLMFYTRVAPRAFPEIDLKKGPRTKSVQEKLYWLVREVDIFLARENSKETKEAIDRIIRDFDVDDDESFGLARLNEDEKSRIHSNIKKIREIIGDGTLSDRKRNALYDRLSALSKEVDMHGTSTDRFFAFMADAAFAASTMTKNAKPFLDEVKDMIKTIGRSRARKEGVSLPPGDEVLQLPPPPKG